MNKILVWDRFSIITPNVINKTVYVYSGKEFKKILITRDKIGFRFGEFCFTRVVKHAEKSLTVRKKK
jgi:ribosomal protein S19